MLEQVTRLPFTLHKWNYTIRACKAAQTLVYRESIKSADPNNISTRDLIPPGTTRG